MPLDPEQHDDIEILEVVGLDDDDTPVEDTDPDDVEVIFDETSDEARPAAPAPAREDAVLKERLIRLQADFENFKKRIDRETADYFRHATGSLVARLLPVLDNFERALASARGGSGNGDGSVPDPLRDGVVLIQRQLLDELSLEGLRPMDSVGTAFDPEIHEAVATEPGSAEPPNTVLAVLQRGYFFHNRLLRPALVRVSVEGGAHPGVPFEREES